MRIVRAGPRPSGAGPAEWFAGRVRLDPPFAVEPATAGNIIIVELGARAARRAHPLR